MTLLFGFRGDMSFKTETKTIFKDIVKILFKSLIYINALLTIYLQYISSENQSDYYIITNLIAIAFIFLLYLFPYILINLLPHYFSKSLGLTMKYVFKRIIKYDKQDPISGLLRYFGYLSAGTGLFQFILLLI